MPLETQRGGNYFADDGYLFVKQKTNLAGTIIYWQCIEYRTALKCPARISTKNGIVQTRKNSHICKASPTKIEVKTFNSEVKQRAISTNEVNLTS